MIDPHGTATSCDPARNSLASVPDPTTSSGTDDAFPSNDWGDDQEQQQTPEECYDERYEDQGHAPEEYHNSNYEAEEHGYMYGEHPQDARSGGGVTFDQPYYGYDDGNNNNGGNKSASSSFRRRSRNHLSKVSREYDAGGKGFLTPAEQQMRKMDVEGKGILSNAAVATIMEGKLRGDEIINRLRRMVWVLGGMTILLILANLGTAWAVAVMAKETSLDSYSGEMYVKDAGDRGPTVVTTRGTGDVFIFANFNVSARSAYVDDSTENGDEDQTVDPENDEEEKDDDSLFCITPDNAAKLWHDATTGTSVSALFDFTPPIDYERAAETAAAGGEEPVSPIDLNSISLQADGAMINETHACLGTGLPASRIGLTNMPSFLCIELISSVCDDMDKESLSPEEETATSNSFARNSDEGGNRRRMLFHSALRNLQSLHPSSFDSSAATGSAANELHLRRGRSERELVPAPERGEGRYAVCTQACADKNKGKKCFKRCRQERKKRRNRRKSVFQQTIPSDITITISTYTYKFQNSNPIGYIGDGTVAESRFQPLDFFLGPRPTPNGRLPVASVPFGPPGLTNSDGFGFRDKHNPVYHPPQQAWD